MRLFEFTSQEISPQQLSELETYIDRLFAIVGLDVEFTNHFKERMNDGRNRQPITIAELQRMFKKVHRQMHKGQDLVKLGPDTEAVLKDLASNINIPFVIKWDQQSKPDFKTSNDILTVEDKKHK